jgi:uncharacterized protein
MNRVFLDTSYAIALSAPTDQFHLQAIQVADQLETNKTQIVTTQAILLEIGNALSKQRYRLAAVVLLESLENDPTVEIVSLSKSIYDSAFCLFRERTDKEWGLVDCISCVVMQEYGINDALTSDDHFRQMGFRPLLRG